MSAPLSSSNDLTASLSPSRDATESPAALVDRLTDNRVIGQAPRAQLEWLVAHSTFRRYDVGDFAVRKGQTVVELIVLLTGVITVHFEHGTGRRHPMRTTAGSVTGLLPYSRLATPPADAVVEEAAELLALHRDRFPEMIRECPAITAACVQLMIDRARTFAASNWQDEKMLSLARLAGGIAHELNNPASAAARGARLIDSALSELGEAARAVGRAGLSDELQAHVDGLVDRCLGPADATELAPLERSDREQTIAAWLVEHGGDSRPASLFADRGITAAVLDELARATPAAQLGIVLRWIAAASSSRAIVRDVERATGRVYDVVSAVKRFTDMDRAAVPEPTNIAQGIKDTVALHASRAKVKSIAVHSELAADLPLIPGRAVELNQVWTNLIDNALDAAPRGTGEVVVRAVREANCVVVRIVDNGPGITPEVKARMFDAFFTTKPVGEGLGLGLDTARRIVLLHDGRIEVDAQPGRTELRVDLPLARESRPAG